MSEPDGQMELYEAEEPTEDSEMVDLDYEYCIARAGLALDKAGVHAEETRDIDSLLKVSYGWMNLADKVSGVVDSEDEPVEPDTTIGFGIQHGKEDSISQGGI